MAILGGSTTSEAHKPLAPYCDAGAAQARSDKQAAAGVPSNGARRQRLPAEIEEMVFRRLGLRELAACAAVCSRWHRRLTPRVFESIEWLDARQLVALVSGLEAAAGTARADPWAPDDGGDEHGGLGSLRRLGQAPSQATLVDGGSDEAADGHCAQRGSPLAHVRRLGGWFTPDASLAAQAHRALVRLVALLGDAAQDAAGGVGGIATLHSDAAFVPDTLLTRVVSLSARTLAAVRLCGATPAQITMLAATAAGIRRLELSTERDDFNVGTHLRTGADGSRAPVVFAALEHLSLSSTSDRPRYPLLSFEQFHAPALRSLELSFLHITDTVLCKVLIRMRGSLERLAIQYVTGVSEGSLGVVPFLCPTVRELELTCINVSDAALEAMARHTDQMRSLTLVGNHRLTGAGVAAVARAWGAALERIDLGMMQLGDGDVAGVLAACTGLRELRLRHLGGISGAALEQAAVSRCARTLQTLEVRFCGGVRAEALERLCADSRMASLVRCRIVGDGFERVVV
ncbi:hypothetical protein HK105_207844 [Polyrhizophydium stewartii]|uniref:F-box domain-containing protein n=1 Tax=Polyrhizophydium stewartii TaxID=2732419 RepID=A0ABR4MZC1_9FUNG